MKFSKLKGKKPKSELVEPVFRKGRQVTNLGKKRTEGAPTNTLLLRGMLGIGDNLYLLPYIRYLSNYFDRIYLRTCFPQIFWDIPANVYLLPRGTTHTPHSENVESNKEMFSEELGINWPETDLRYTALDLRDGSCWTGIEKRISKQGWNNVAIPNKLNYKLKIKNGWMLSAEELLKSLGINVPFAIARSCTHRWDWNCPAKTPDPRALQYGVDLVSEKMPVIELGYLNRREEFVDGPYQNTHSRFVKGEVSITTLIALMKLAKVTLSPPGFAQPVSVAIGCPSVVFFGGYTGQWSFEDPRVDSSWVKPIYPEPFCNCVNRWHEDCNREIDPSKIEKTIKDVLR